MGGGRKGRGEVGEAENFTWGAELIKCIDPNEGEALRRGAVERRGEGRREGREILPGGGIDQMY